MASPIGAFKLSCLSITFTELSPPSPSSAFNLMLPWEGDLDQGLKTFLLRQAGELPSIFPQPADTFMFRGRIMSRHVKEQKLALFTSLERETAVEVVCQSSEPEPHLVLAQHGPTYGDPWMHGH